MKANLTLLKKVETNKAEYGEEFMDAGIDVRVDYPYLADEDGELFPSHFAMVRYNSGRVMGNEVVDSPSIIKTKVYDLGVCYAMDQNAVMETLE